jgi:hypothetical protein
MAFPTRHRSVSTSLWLSVSAGAAVEAAVVEWFLLAALTSDPFRNQSSLHELLRVTVGCYDADADTGWGGEETSEIMK